MRYSTCVSQPVARLFLEHGADEAMTENVEFSEHGVRFRSPWNFESFSELSLAIAWDHPRLGVHRACIEGVVIESRPLDDGYETTLLLLDAPTHFPAT